MPTRTWSPLKPVTACLVALSLAGCGGAGPRAAVFQVTPPPATSASCGTPAVAAQPTARPGYVPTTSPTLTPSSYTFQSNPSGIAVTINGSAAGVTPFTSSPAYSNTPQTVQFGTGAGAYTVTIDQTANGPHTIFYNQVTDTGSASLTGSQSVARHGAAIAGETRRAIRTSAPSTVAATGLYVRYDNAKAGSARIAQAEAAAGVTGGADVLQTGTAVRGRVVHVAPGADLAAVTAQLQKSPGVLGVYPLHQRFSLAVTPCVATDPYFTGTIVPKAIACALACQWDLRQIHSDYAWQYTHGASARIAVIDTGVDLTHPDISPVVRYQATTVGGGVNTAKGAGGNQAAYEAAQDTNGHGTNVAGIATASTNDSTGFAGVGYGTQLYAYRIFPPATGSSDGQSADTGDEALAITDAVRQGVDVINLSIGAAQNDPTAGPGFDQAEHDAVEAAIAAGVTVVAAAGNDSGDHARRPGRLRRRDQRRCDLARRRSIERQHHRWREQREPDGVRRRVFKCGARLGRRGAGRRSDRDRRRRLLALGLQRLDEYRGVPVRPVQPGDDLRATCASRSSPEPRKRRRT